jgi:hypothetical protein
MRKLNNLLNNYKPYIVATREDIVKVLKEHPLYPINPEEIGHIHEILASLLLRHFAIYKAEDKGKPAK